MLPTITAVIDRREAIRILGAGAALGAISGRLAAAASPTSDGCAQCALDQADLFEKAGVDLRHVVIGHLNDIRVLIFAPKTA